MRMKVVVLCLIRPSRKGRPDPERLETDRQIEPFPGTQSYTEVGLCKRLTLHPSQACTVLYTIEIISSFNLLSSGSAHQRPSSLCTDEDAGTQRGEVID